MFITPFLPTHFETWKGISLVEVMGAFLGELLCFLFSELLFCCSCYCFFLFFFVLFKRKGNIGELDVWEEKRRERDARPSMPIVSPFLTFLFKPFCLIFLTLWLFQCRNHHGKVVAPHFWGFGGHIWSTHFTRYSLILTLFYVCLGRAARFSRTWPNPFFTCSFYLISLNLILTIIFDTTILGSLIHRASTTHLYIYVYRTRISYALFPFIGVVLHIHR